MLPLATYGILEQERNLEERADDYLDKFMKGDYIGQTTVSIGLRLVNLSFFFFLFSFSLLFHH